MVDEAYGGHYYIGPDAWDKTHLISAATQSAERMGKPQLIHQHKHAEKCQGHTHLRVAVDEDPIEVEYPVAQRV